MKNFPILLSQPVLCLKLWNLDVINILTQRHNFLYLYFFVFQKFIAKSAEKRRLSELSVIFKDFMKLNDFAQIGFITGKIYRKTNEKDECRI